MFCSIVGDRRRGPADGALARRGAVWTCGSNSIVRRATAAAAHEPWMQARPSLSRASSRKPRKAKVRASESQQKPRSAARGSQGKPRCGLRKAKESQLKPRIGATAALPAIRGAALPKVVELQRTTDAPHRLSPAQRRKIRACARPERRGMPGDARKCRCVPESGQVRAFCPRPKRAARLFTDVDECLRLLTRDGGGGRHVQIALPLPGSPRSCHIASTFFTTSSLMRILRPHSRFTSPGHLSVASRPILEPSPETGEAKSR